jgi:cytochrome c oxidase assembly protein subunit 15
MSSRELKEEKISKTDKLIVIWLLSTTICVLAMVFIGGVTRLTNSGLSIVEWKPITGIIFPLTEQAWLAEFAKYQLSPEFIKLNFNMNLDEFKFIYFLEYFHRLFGRLTGLVFFLPLIYFSAKKQITKPLFFKLLIIGFLGAIQGFVGWYMVKSGLKDMPHVSHFRLTFHLGMAVIILSMLLWQAFDILDSHQKISDKTLRNHSITISILIFLQILLGGLVAGLDAGLIYSDFPFMGTGYIPVELYSISSVTQFLNDPASTQFTHRVLGISIGLYIFYLWIGIIFNKLPKKIKICGNLLMILVVCQIMLGILTIWWQVPVSTASLHQMTAVLLLSASLYLQHCCKRIKQI